MFIFEYQLDSPPTNQTITIRPIAISLVTNQTDLIDEITFIPATKQFLTSYSRQSELRGSFYLHAPNYISTTTFRIQLQLEMESYTTPLEYTTTSTFIVYDMMALIS